MKFFIFLLLVLLAGCDTTWHIQTDLRAESESHKIASLRFWSGGGFSFVC